MKCEICKKNIEQTFLKKILGTTVKDAKGKMHYVCKDCQKANGNDKKQMLSKL